MSSANGIASPASSVPRVAACCSARVSVGAIIAAWWPAASARSIAYTATTVLPEPTSPMSRRCIGRVPARSASIAAKASRWPSVGANGSDASQRSTSSPVGSIATAGRRSSRAPRRSASAAWCRQSSSNASRSRAARACSGESGKCAQRSASTSAASRRRARSSAGSGSIASAARSSACQAHSRKRFAESRALALCTGTIPVVWMPAGPAPARPPETTSWVATRKPERSSLPLSSSRVPGCRRSAR